MSNGNRGQISKSFAEDYKRRRGNYPPGYKPTETAKEELSRIKAEAGLSYLADKDTPYNQELWKKTGIIKPPKDPSLSDALGNIREQAPLWVKTEQAYQDSLLAHKKLGGERYKPSDIRQKEEREAEKEKETGKALMDQYNLLMNDLREISEIKGDSYTPKKGMEARFDEINKRLDVLKEQMKKPTLPEYKPYKPLVKREWKGQAW